MASRRGESRPQRPPATTPEGRENQLIAAAFDLAEKQILEGTATSQTLSHFLKLGSPRERIEREKLQSENELLKARIAAMESASRIEEMYSEAITAMRSYAGITEADENDQEILQ